MNHASGLSGRELVFAGNGMAAGRLRDKLIARTLGDCDLAILRAEPRVECDRIMLSPVPAGEKESRKAIVDSEARDARSNVDLPKDESVVAIGRAVRNVRTPPGIIAAAA